MKTIAISQRVYKEKKYGELRDQLDIKLSEFVIKLGFLPIPIPNFKKKNKADTMNLVKWLKRVKPSGIILSGGDDIGKFIHRDQNELKIINWSIANKIPIAGICRGMQIIAHKFNVKLIKVKNHAGTRHFVISPRNKKFKRIVNSFHNLALKKCPKSFDIVNYSLDGVIESIENKSKKIYACMWHPEREKKFNKRDIFKFKSFFLK